jgi:hemoglobin
MSLYEELGGAPAIRAALDHFYDKKVLADDRIREYFEEVNLENLKRAQTTFFAMALGGPNEYTGRDIRTAHELPRQQGLNEEHYHVFMDHFVDTLTELGVPEPKIEEVMAIAHTGKDEVLDN